MFGPIKSRYYDTLTDSEAYLAERYAQINKSTYVFIIVN